MKKNFFFVFLIIFISAADAQITPEITSWIINTTGETGIIFSTDNVNYSSNNNTSGAYRVRVTPSAVPEPCTPVLLMGLGLSGSAIACRRLRRRPRLPA